MAKPEATGGNPPKVKKPASSKPVKAKKGPSYSYIYDHATGLYTMNAAALTAWLMDVEGRAKLERALSEALDIAAVDTGKTPIEWERLTELRKLVPKKEKT